MKTVTFWRSCGLTMEGDLVALCLDAAGSLPYGYGVLAWTSQQRRTNKTNRRPTQPPSRCRLGSSDAAAMPGRRSSRRSRSKPNGSNSKSRTSAVVERTGAAKRKPPAESRKRFGPRTPTFKPDWTHLQRQRKKKARDLPALVDNPSFAETPAAHGYTCGVIALFLGLVQLGVSLRAASRVLEFIARFFGLPFSAPDWTTGRMWVLRFGLAQLNAPKDQADD